MDLTNFQRARDLRKQIDEMKEEKSALQFQESCISYVEGEGSHYQLFRSLPQKMIKLTLIELLENNIAALEKEFEKL